MKTRLIFLLFAVASPSLAQDTRNDPNPVNLQPTFPIVDAPFNLLEGNPFPSMRQSIDLSKSFYQLGHYGIGRLFNLDAPGWKGFWINFSLIGFDAVLGMKLPPGEAWLHEEWHRAVMSNRGISSHNGVYDHDGEVIPVNHVSDENLIRLKRDHPADQIRLAEAGMEAEHELALALEKDQFFSNTRTHDWSTILITHISTTQYLETCASKDADRITTEGNKEDGSNVGERDFTGLDCNGWVYDLHRPQEPYEDRGTHPSGVGIDRYRNYSDLSTDERNYLRLQRNLSWLNMLDPFWVELRGFRLSDEAPDLARGRGLWNATVRHNLTSFGYALDLNLFLGFAAQPLLFTWHHYVNHDRDFPGAEVWLPNIDLLSGNNFITSLRLMAWQQPKDQAFYTRKAEAGGLAAVQIGYKYESLTPYIEIEAKSPGWVAGNVYLDDNVSTRIGVRSQLF